MLAHVYSIRAVPGCSSRTSEYSPCGGGICSVATVVAATLLGVSVSTFTMRWLSVPTMSESSVRTAFVTS